MTLMEIMVVVILMALIASAVALAVMHQLEVAKERQTKADVRTVHHAVELSRTDDGGCPTIDDLDLGATARLVDAWDHDFAIECDGSITIVRSAGPDGDMGTADDIQVPEPDRLARMRKRRR